ncbi:MAG: hypothetical protein AAF903_13845 [Pseudomonadota bacterium]
MIQLIAVAAVGGVALVAYNSFKKHWAEIQEKEALEKSRQPKPVGDLHKDEVTGKYRLKDD